MNIAAIQFPVFLPYIKSTVEIYVSGCNNKCKGCHNPELQSFEYGDKLNLPKLIDYLKEREKLFQIISITGGDLLEQDLGEVYPFIAELKTKFPNKEFWLFTGHELRSFKNSKYIPIIFDKIKIGLYKENEKQEGFPASRNQKLLTKGIDY